MINKTQAISDAKELGRMAFNCGQRLDDNIFVNGSILRKAWKDGFVQAASNALITVNQGEQNVIHK